MRQKNQRAAKRAALDAVKELFEQAFRVFAKQKALARRYVALARQVSTRHRIRIPKPYKRFYCRKCDSLLVPGKSSRVRLTRGKVSITCLECGSVRRYGYFREKKEKKAG